MSKRLAVAVVACACMAVAYGAAVKITSFAAFGPDSDADGMAILNYKQGQDNTVAQIILSDLKPSTAYVVALAFPGTWNLEGTDEVLLVNVSTPERPSFFFAFSAGEQGQLSTDSKGHLTLHGTAFGGDNSDSDVLIFLHDDWAPVFDGAVDKFRIPVRMIGYNGTNAPGP